MPFEGGVCDRCGALTKYDTKTRKYYCEHCGAVDYKKDTINHFTANINDLHLDGVHFDSEMTVEMKMKLKAAEASIILGKYEDALKRFQTLCDDIPHDYRVWWGQIRAKTQELNADVKNKVELNSLCGLYDSMMHFIPATYRDEVEQRFMSYIQFQDEKLEQRIRDLQMQKKALQEEYEDVQTELMEWQVATYESSEQSLEIAGGVFAAALVLGVFGRSLLLILAAVVGFGYYYLILEPSMKQKEADWMYEKQKCIEELTHRSQAIEQKLKEIDDKQQDLTT